MIDITPISTLRAGRLVADFRELSIANSIKILGIPAHEAGISEFLKAIVTQSSVALDKLTVAERTMMTCHYIGHFSSENADFPVGENRLSDYIMFDSEYSDPSLSITLEGDTWSAQQLLGIHAEAIERLEGQFEVENRLHWQAGLIACQLRLDSDPEHPDDEWIIKRMQMLLDKPERFFYELLDFLLAATVEMAHLFKIWISPEGSGLSAYPPTEEGEAGIAPARFPSRLALHERTLREYNQLS